MGSVEITEPGLRHLREEKDRQKMLVSKPTHGGGAPLGIDLDAGVAKIKLTRPAPPADPADSADPAESGEAAAAREGAGAATAGSAEDAEASGNPEPQG